MKNNYKKSGLDLVEEFFSLMKIEDNFSEELRQEVLINLNILKERIARDVEEVINERNDKIITDDDIIKIIKQAVPWWKPVLSDEKIEKIINFGVKHLKEDQRSIECLSAGGWGVYRDWIGKLARSEEQAKQWMKEPPTRIWDTATTIITLLRVGMPKDSEIIQKGIEWLKKQEKNDDGGYPFLPREYWQYLRPECRPIASSVYETGYALLALIEAGEDVNSPDIRMCLKFLQETQHPIYGAWGPTRFENMSVGATSTAVMALIEAKKNPTSQSIQNAIHWLKENQREDGGWGENHKEGSKTSLVTKTYDAITALKAVGFQQTDDTIKDGIRYLLNIQKIVRSERGEWGWVWSPEVEIDISEVENTATAIMALLICGQSADHLAIKMGINWLLKNRDSNGTWEKDTPRVILCLRTYLDYSHSVKATA